MALLGKLIGFAYWLLLMPLAALLSVILPFMAISNGKDVITYGYSFPGSSNGNLDVAWVLCTIVYVSLRFRGLNRFYAVFPSAYQMLKMFTISSLFTSVAMAAVNVAFKEAGVTRRTAGAVAFFALLLAWRVFMSVYYTRNPVVPFIEKEEEELAKFEAAG
ncbi:MAG: hypothetical protein NUV93_02555 [Firmicutes bacterium]|nr:hypothetical protein [Bacillota bacterium]